MGLFQPAGAAEGNRFQLDIPKLTALQSSSAFTSLDDAAKSRILDMVEALQKLAAEDGSLSFEETLDFSLALENVVGVAEQVRCVAFVPRRCAEPLARPLHHHLAPCSGCPPSPASWLCAMLPHVRRPSSPTRTPPLPPRTRCARRCSLLALSLSTAPTASMCYPSHARTACWRGAAARKTAALHGLVAVRAPTFRLTRPARPPPCCVLLCRWACRRHHATPLSQGGSSTSRYVCLHPHIAHRTSHIAHRTSHSTCAHTLLGTAQVCR